MFQQALALIAQLRFDTVLTAPGADCALGFRHARIGPLLFGVRPVTVPEALPDCLIQTHRIQMYGQTGERFILGILLAHHLSLFFSWSGKNGKQS